MHGVGIFTLPEMELPFGEMAPLIDEIERVAYEVIGRDKFLDDARRRALDHAAARVGGGAQVSRACRCCRSTRTPTCATPTWARAHNHACAMRRSLEYATMTQVGIRSLSTEEAEVAAPAEHDGLLRRRHAAGSEVDRQGRGIARRERLRQHRRGRHGPGDHAGDRDARAGRPVVARDHDAAPRTSPSGARIVSPTWSS